MNLTETDEKQLDTDIDIIDFDVDDAISYWRKNGWNNNTIFGPLFKQDDGSFSVPGKSITKSYLGKCRDVLTMLYFIPIYGNKRNSSYSTLAKGELTRSQVEKIIDKEQSHQKLLVAFTNGSNSPRVNKTLILLNAIEEHLDNVFEGSRSFVTNTNKEAAVVFNMPNNWCTTIVMISLYSFIIRYCYNIPDYSDPGQLLDWFLTSKPEATPVFVSDKDYIVRARDIIKELKQHGLHPNRINYFNGDSLIPYNYNYGIHAVNINVFDPNKTIDGDSYPAWARCSLKD